MYSKVTSISPLLFCKGSVLLHVILKFLSYIVGPTNRPTGVNVSQTINKNHNSTNNDGQKNTPASQPLMENTVIMATVIGVGGFVTITAFISIVVLYCLLKKRRNAQDPVLDEMTLRDLITTISHNNGWFRVDSQIGHPPNATSSSNHSGRHDDFYTMRQSAQDIEEMIGGRSRRNLDINSHVNTGHLRLHRMDNHSRISRGNSYHGYPVSRDISNGQQRRFTAADLYPLGYERNWNKL